MVGGVGGVGGELGGLGGLGGLGALGALEALGSWGGWGGYAGGEAIDPQKRQPYNKHSHVHSYPQALGLPRYLAGKTQQANVERAL